MVWVPAVSILRGFQTLVDRPAPVSQPPLLDLPGPSPNTAGTLGTAVGAARRETWESTWNVTNRSERITNQKKKWIERINLHCIWLTGREKRLYFQLDCRQKNWGWASKLGGLSCSHLPAGLHWEGVCNWRRRILLVRADEAKMSLQSLGFSSEKRWKKKEQNKPRTSFDKYDQIGSFQYCSLWVLVSSL